jgi:hypothetical protein
LNLGKDYECGNRQNGDDADDKQYLDKRETRLTSCGEKFHWSSMV